MDKVSKGGRGKRAPYKTVMCRMPEPIKGLADELAATYRELLVNYDDPTDPELINKVKSAFSEVNQKEIIASAITGFIQEETDNYGVNGSQKGKEFNMRTRKWDAFKAFMTKFI